MDIYHKVIVKIYEATGGRDSQTVDLKDLVKKMGFIGHYADIFNRLSGEGWIAEDRKADFVRITHWGIAEAKKASESSENDKTELAKSANAANCANLAKEFASLVEKFAQNASKENLQNAEAKFAEMETAFNLAKNEVA